MQIGQEWKIKMYNPGLLLHNLKDSFKAWLRTNGSQLTLNGVAFSNVKTVKKTIGGVGVADCDFNFATAANTTEQVIDLGAIVPANARILDVRLHTTAQFTGATTLVAEAGTTSSGHELINSATIYALDAILPMAADHFLTVVPVITAGHVFVACTPGSNWSAVTAGKVSVLVTYIEEI